MRKASRTLSGCWRLIGGTLLVGAQCAGILTQGVQAEAQPQNGILLRDQEITSEGFFRFNFIAEADKSYHIQVSDDSVNWRHFTNAVGTGNLLWIEDQVAPTSTRRLYQVARPPIPITNMVYIAPGSFSIGSPQTEPGRNANEGPQTIVTISHGYWIGKYEVIQKDFEELTGSHASLYVWERLPVDFASWTQATNFCHRLTERERAAGRLSAGFIYRLPTEAEWEYACRAGGVTPVSLGDGTSLSSTQANFDGTFPYGDAAPGPFVEATKLPGAFPANAWGLHDMHGNVAEWCQDFFGAYGGGNVTDPKGPITGTTRVIRGGYYSSPGNSCRSAKRDGRSPTLRNFGQGFRVALAVVP